MPTLKRFSHNLTASILNNLKIPSHMRDGAHQLENCIKLPRQVP